jgi:hypothetical protein
VGLVGFIEVGGGKNLCVPLLLFPYPFLGGLPIASLIMLPSPLLEEFPLFSNEEYLHSSPQKLVMKLAPLCWMLCSPNILAAAYVHHQGAIQ